jgi:TRAP-type mannitol/chloroaromatic compound transport system permease small subunit
MRPASRQALAGAGRFLDPALTLAEAVARRMVWVGGSLLLAAAVTVSVDVIVRKAFTLSLGGADELSGYAFAIGVAWALPFTLLQRANIRIDALYARLPARIAAALDVVALIALAVFVTVLTRYAWEVVAGSWRLNSLSNSALNVPLWIPQGIWFFGLSLFFFTILLLTLRTVLALASGDLARVRELAGARGIEEESAEEAAYSRSLHRDSADAP